jgi:hypothetical protein
MRITSYAGDAACSPPAIRLIVATPPRSLALIRVSLCLCVYICPCAPHTCVHVRAYVLLGIRASACAHSHKCMRPTYICVWAGVGAVRVCACAAVRIYQSRISGGGQSASQSYLGTLPVSANPDAHWAIHNDHGPHYDVPGPRFVECNLKAVLP